MSSGLFRTVATQVAPTLRSPAVVQRATVFTRPAKDELNFAETVFGLSMFAVGILGPAGWILANLENYKKKD